MRSLTCLGSLDAPVCSVLSSLFSAHVIHFPLLSHVTYNEFTLVLVCDAMGCAFSYVNVLFDLIYLELRTLN